ncbi:MAG: orotidine-5'-phosphate decarboxylase [Bacteroidales bacterium]
MTKQELVNNIKAKGSFLCVGLDPDLAKMPESLKGNLLEFNKQIIDATAKYTVAYKPNLAFYECMGVKGYEAFEQTVKYIQDNYPDIFIIADAKRGDIGNTSKMYAQSFFGEMNINAVTVAPYMGEDSITPFLGYDNKWVIVLGLTSNKGSHDFQLIKDENGTPLFETVLRKTSQWGSTENMMYVVGATQGIMFEEIRKIVPEHFLLVPGVGAQGGSLQDVVKYGINSSCGLLVNSSRGIIHASNGDDFASIAGEKAKEMQQEMATLLKEHEII